MFYTSLTGQEKEEMLQAVMETLFNDKELIVTDHTGKIILVTQSFADHNGVPPEEILCRSSVEMMTDNVYTKSASTLSLQTGNREAVLTNRGSNDFVLGYSTPIKEDGKMKYVLSEGIGVEWLLKMMNEVCLDELPSPALSSLREKLLFSSNEIIYQSETMKNVIDRARKVAKFDTNTLLLGETGVGKDLLARQIHKWSGRKDQPFVPVAIPMIAPNLLESELFGYVGGAFTGATKEGKIGLFEAANGGTAFLDEVGDIPMDMQVKLLRVLENQEIFRVGSNKPIKLNIRIIAATNRNLPKMVAEGTFREDLLYRLNVLSIKVPPLRERQDDITPLAQYFLQHTNYRYHLNRTFTPETLELLRQYDWPGNVRFLRNFVEKAAILADNEVIDTAQVHMVLDEMSAETYTPAASATTPAPASPGPDQNNIMEEFTMIKRENILNALVQCNGNKSKAAKVLHISRSHLYKLLKEYQEL